jgi:uncharacterized membrane protein HdeD (DUF308 family)
MSDPTITDPSGGRASAQALREITGAWWILVLVGCLSVVAGAIVLAEPDNSLSVLVIVSGIYIVLSSLLELWSVAFVSRSGTAALFGVLGIVIGILLIRHPIHGILAATLLVGLWFVAIGVIRLLDALGMERRAWALAVAALQIVVGIVLVASPHIGLATLALLIGLSFILNGVALVALGTVLRALHRAAPPAAAAPPAGASPAAPPDPAGRT